MRKNVRSEAGFTLIEMLVAIGLFAVVSVTMYQLMFSAVRSSDTSEDIVRVSEEARMGLNRMIRDTREGQVFGSLTANSYRVQVDFDGDGTYQNSSGNYEDLELEYSWARRAILLNDEVLIAGAEPIGSTKTIQNTDPEDAVFSFTSNDLQYDTDGNGVTTDLELQSAGLDETDASLYSNVEFAFQVRVGKHVTEFFGQAQLRNRR
jgi:prepilin-type N-terminal cleavage/methylation domain-containing protein